MIRTSNIVKYLPQYVQNYREIKHITDVENPELQILIDETEVVKNNQFITTCNEVGIKFFEDLLGIYASDGEDLEYRKQRVLLYWHDLTPYTYRVFIEKLNILFGESNYILTPNFNQYELQIEVIVDIQLSSQASDLDHLLKHMIPANIKVISEIRKEYDLEEEIFLGTAVVSKKIITVEMEQKQYELNGVNTLGSAMSVYKQRTINLE